jgi:hypothetical protein
MGRASADPFLVIRADGTVAAHDPYGFVKPKDEGRIDVAELQDLLSFAIRNCGFFKSDDERLREVIAEGKVSRELVEAADAGFTVLRIRTRDKSHEVRIYPVSPWNRLAWPDNEQLTLMRNMHALVVRLERVFAKITLSDRDELTNYLRIANEHLKNHQPDVQPLTAEHLSMARRGRESIAVTFCRPAENPKRTIVVSIDKAKQAKAEVHVIIRE